MFAIGMQRLSYRFTKAAISGVRRVYRFCPNDENFTGIAAEGGLADYGGAQGRGGFAWRVGICRGFSFMPPLHAGADRYIFTEQKLL